ncbi:Gfo/Idh/MocA family oxidoreductase [Niabella sp. 3A5MI-3]|nr:Gfo/Idh/MocA family oxidoreductase [Niabella beijingensis]
MGAAAFTPGLNKEVVRVGLIGVGQRGLGLAGTLKKIKTVQLVACCDIDEAHLQAGMKLAAAGARSYKDYKALLADKNVEAVIIATPLYLHHSMAMDAISANKHTYVEKTMTYNIGQALSLARAMKQHPKLVLQVGHQYRYYEMYPKIKKLLAEDMIGTVTHFESQYNRNNNWRRPVDGGRTEKTVNWRMYKEYSGGLLAELAAHQIDLVNWLAGAPPESVVAMGGINFWKDGRTTYDNIHAVYAYPGGVRSLVGSVLSNEFVGYRMRIFGSKGTFELGRDYAMFYTENRVKTYATVDGVTGATKEALEQGKGIYVYKDEKKTEPTFFALSGFADSIINGTPVASSVLTGKDVAIAVHMGNAAAETGQVQRWQPDYSAI